MADPNTLNPYERIWKTRDLRALETPIELENNTSQFGRGLNAFGKEMQATGYGLAALGAQGLENVIGENAVTSGITDWGIEGYKKAIDESQSGYNAPNVADVSNIKGVGDFTDWASYQLGKGLPMLGSLVLSGGVGGAVARLTAKEGIKQIAKGAVGGAVKKGVETKALQAAEGQIITKTMQDAAAKVLRDRTVAGTMTGGFAGSFGLEGGLAFGEQVEAGVKPEDAVKSAIAVGGINGALEFLPFYGVAKSIGMGQYAKKSIKEIIKNDAGLSKKAIALATAKELGGRALKGGLVGAGAEGITEGLQELTAVAGLRWAKQDPLFADLSDDDWNRIGNAMAAGALVGGVAAGAGSTLKGPKATDNAPTGTNAPPAGTVVPPAVKTREQEIEAGLAKITTDLEAAKAAGDTKAIQELQQIKEMYDAALGKQKPVLEPVLETPPNEQVQPVTEEQPIPGTTEAQVQPPLEIPAGPEGTGGVREEGAGTETRPAVQPTPGERIQLKRGEEIVLTPNGTPVRTTPTPEEVEALRQRMGPRPEKQPIEDTANAQEVQAQIEAQIKASAIPVQTELEKQAIVVGNNKDKLKERLTQAKSVLDKTTATLFKDATYDFDNKRLISKDGNYALQWKIRDNPEEPSSYTNQQTNAGVVSLINIGNTPAQVKGTPPLYSKPIGEIKYPIRDATSLFDDNEINKNREQRFKSRDKLISMPIDEFLNLAEPTKEDEVKRKNIEDVIQSGAKLSDVPFLQIKNNGAEGAVVVGHEGRHRALALKRAEYTHMPVIMAMQPGKGVGIRWTEQQNPEKFDYVPEGKWPSKLISENGKVETTFPVTREQALEAYREQGSKQDEEVIAAEATMEEFEAVRRQFQERQSQTPFKKWFGTGTPNVTATKEGEPITLYHGTNNPAFFEWDSTKAGEASGHPTSGLGFFMTANPGAAARYGNNLLELHAKINNPYTLTDADLTSIETTQDAVQLRKRLMSKGYDGAVVTAPGASPYVIAFQANQIKLKSNTAPTDSLDMRYSKPLQTVTPEMDAEYLAAVERGDMKTAQRMVNEAAKAAGYTIDAWHGTTKRGLKRIRPDKAVETESTIFLAENEDVADTFTIPREYGEPVYEDENGEEISPGENIKAKLMLQNPLILKEDAAQKFVDDTAFQGRTVKQAIADGYDGIIAQNVLEGIGERYRGDNYVVFREGLIKRADPVTYDDAGNVIPLSQRFNEATPDIRYTQQPGTTTIPLQDFQSNIDSIMGEGWLQQATEAGLVEVIEGEGPNGESGSWAGDRIRLYTGSMPKDGSPAGVLLHEGKHVTFEDVLRNSLPEYIKDLHTLADNGNKVAQDAITHAAIAVADVLGIKHNLLEGGTKADLKNLRVLIEQERPGLLAEEELAYFVQYGTDAQTGTGFWKRLVNQIKAWFAQTRLGQRMKELGIGFEMTDTMAVEWAKMGLNRSLENLRQAEKARIQAEKQASTMPASARLGRVLAALDEIDPLYTFAGKQALTANLTLRLEAEQRIKLGESAESVRQDTGWFLNKADGQWRFEISDKDMQLKILFDSIPESKLFKEQPVNLEDVIVHDKLFAAYPFLKNISLIKQEAFLDLGDTQGWFNPDKMQISVTPTAADPLSTILHEIQHVVQMYEGFAKGGNENSAWAALPNETKEDIIKGVVNKLTERNQREQEKLEILNQIAGLDNDYIRQYRQYRKAEREIGFSQEQELFEKEFFKFFDVTSARDFNYTKRRVFRSIVEEGDNLDVYRDKVNKELLRNMEDITKVKAGDERAIKIHVNLYDFYKRLAGETEARLTQARQQMTEEELQSTSPESMMDYPYDKQIVVMSGAKTSDEVFYSMGIQEIREQLWNDPTDVRPEIVNKPGLLQKWRADFVDFFAEMEKKSKDIYDTYSLLRSKKAARIEQARQEYFLPLRKQVTESPWTAKEVGDMAAARHIKVDNVNIELAKSASYGYTKELLKALSTAKRKELMQARVHVKAGKMPDRSVYLDANGNPAQMSARTKQQLMFDLMNKYSQYEITGADGIQVLREEWELFKDAAAGFSDGGVGSTKVRTVDEVLKLADKDRAKFDQIMTLFDAANRHALELLENGGLITATEHARLLLDKSAYAPLRRESYKVDEEIARLFQRAGQGGSKQIATRSGTENLSEPTLVLQNALAAIEAAAAAAERNLANKELYKVVVKDRAGWKPWFTIVEKDKYVTHDEDGFLQEKNATASNRADITLINDGKKLVIRPNMHNERAVGFVRAVNNLDAQVINGPMKVLGWLNQIVRWVNVSASPIFLMTNAFKDPFTAFYNIKATEAEKYTKEIFSPKTYKDSFRALKKVFMDGNRDPTDPDVQWVEKWELAGGRTSFIETLRDMDETWKSFDKQVSRRKGTILGINTPGFKSLMQAKDKWIDGLENFNILFENVMRFSTFKVLMEKGAVSEAQAARISQDLTTNFTRRGYKTQALGTWWLFFNATVQGNYQVLRNLMSSKKVQAAVGGTVVMALLLDLLGRAVDDDWDKVSEWDKERFIILPIKVAGDFVRIPAPWVYNVVWRMGGLLGEMLSGIKEPQDGLLDIAAMATTTFNPLGKPGSLAQAISPTGFDPFMQIIENKNFAGNPIGPEGFPGASKKANSELMWSSTPKGYKSFARFVNEATGGSAVESGAIDLKPGDYQILVNFLTGSLGRFMSDATFGVKEALDKDFEGMKDIPIAKEFFSDPYDPLKSQKYHTNIAGIYGAHKLEQLYVKGPDRDLIKLQEVRENRGKELRMYSQAQDVERQIKSLRVRLRAAQNREDTAREKELRDRIGKIQERFNNVYQQRMG